MKNIKTSASILSADMINLENVIKQLEECNIDMLHFDVMDGVFVKNITFGIPILKAIRQKTNLFLDVHLMIIDPIKYIKQFAEAGADLITFHLESNSDPMETLNCIHSYGIQSGIVIKPNTPYEEVLPYIPYSDVVLVMTVEPGFGGQSFMENMIEKVSALSSYIEKNNLKTKIEVDGGINDKTSSIAVSAGAEILVAGSYLFNHKDKSSAVKTLKSIS